MTDDRQRGEDPRVTRSRSAILDAATDCFLRSGYTTTSMDDIADAAEVSKRTIYNVIGGKDELFAEVVMRASAVAQHFASDAAAELAGATAPDDLPAALHALARRQLHDITRPGVIRLRRLLIAEAERFPDLAERYRQAAPATVLSALADAFAQLMDDGLMRRSDPTRAAEHFAFLVLGATLDQALLDGTLTPPDPEVLDRAAADGVDAFLAAYRTG